MPFSSEWIIPKRIFYIHFTGIVSIDEVHQGNAVIKQAQADGQAPIHTIVDVDGLTGYPIDIRLIGQSYPFGDKAGWAVLVGASGVVKYVGNFLTSVAKTKIHNSSNKATGLEFLKSQDPALFDD